MYVRYAGVALKDLRCRMAQTREISLTKRTLRYSEIPSLGIYIEKFHHNREYNEVHLMVRYVALLEPTSKSSKIELLVLPLTRFRNEFEIDLSEDDSPDFNWRPLEEIMQ